MSVKLRELKKGDWFTLKNTPKPKENQVWIKDEYDRSNKKYICTRWNDIGDSREFSGDKEVYTEFTF